MQGEALVGTKRRKVTQMSNSPSVISTYGGVTSTTGTAGELYPPRAFSHSLVPSELDECAGEIHLNIDSMLKNGGD